MWAGKIPSPSLKFPFFPRFSPLISPPTSCVVSTRYEVEKLPFFPPVSWFHPNFPLLNHAWETQNVSWEKSSLPASNSLISSQFFPPKFCVVSSRYEVENLPLPFSNFLISLRFSLPKHKIWGWKKKNLDFFPSHFPFCIVHTEHKMWGWKKKKNPQISLFSSNFPSPILRAWNCWVVLVLFLFFFFSFILLCTDFGYKKKKQEKKPKQKSI